VSGCHWRFSPPPEFVRVEVATVCGPASVEYFKAATVNIHPARAHDTQPAPHSTAVARLADRPRPRTCPIEARTLFYSFRNKCSGSASARATLLMPPRHAGFWLKLVMLCYGAPSTHLSAISAVSSWGWWLASCDISQWEARSPMTSPAGAACGCVTLRAVLLTSSTHAPGEPIFWLKKVYLFPHNN
jgi:hypothetical protein